MADQPKKQPTTATWKANVKATLDSKGWGAQAAMAKELGMSTGALSECLSDAKQYSQWVTPVDDYFRRQGWGDPDPSRWVSPQPVAPTQQTVEHAPATARAAARLRQLREAAGFDPAGLASAARLRLDTVLAFESGERKLELDDIEHLAKVMKYDPGDFVSPHDPEPSQLQPKELWYFRRLLWTDEEREQMDEIAQRALDDGTLPARVIPPLPSEEAKAAKAKLGELRKPKVQQQGKPQRRPKR